MGCGRLKTVASQTGSSVFKPTNLRRLSLFRESAALNLDNTCVIVIIAVTGICRAEKPQSLKGKGSLLLAACFQKPRKAPMVSIKACEFLKGNPLSIST